MTTQKAFSVEIPVSILKAASRFVADTKDCREYLRGIYLESTPDACFVVATDGHAMFAAKVPATNGAFGDGKAIIPATVGKLKVSRYTPGVAIVITPEGDGQNFTAATTEGTVGGRCISGFNKARPFIDWLRVIPSEVSGEVAQHDPELMMRCKNAAHDLGSRIGCISVGYNGNGAALVTLGSVDALAVAVVMPWREDAAVAPEWLLEATGKTGLVSVPNTARKAA